MSDAQSPKKRMFAIWVGSIVFFLICCGVWLSYWLIWGQFQESTNDAYVNGNAIVVKPFEAGIIVSILADNAQMVEKGQRLVELNRHDFEIALEKAQAYLAQTVREVVQMFLKVQELEAKIQVYEALYARAQLDYNHRSELVSDGSVSREDFEHSETDLAGAMASLSQTQKQWAEAVAQIGDTTPFTHPKVEIAKAELKSVFLALHRCTVVAPVSGIVSQRRAQIGQWVNAEDPLMVIVPLDQIWVDANFREVQLKNLRVGQSVEVFSDMYGRDIKFHGRVVGLNPGTGAVFSILPPQNASGNWIKIIQRVPVKIGLNAEEIKEHPLVLGLSMTTSANTHNRLGLRLAAPSASQPIYSTDVYAGELDGAEQMIEEIFAQNCSCEGESL